MELGHRKTDLFEEDGGATLATALALHGTKIQLLAAGTAHCPAHGDRCVYVTSIAIVFTSTSTPPPVEGFTPSGRIFHGTMTINRTSCAAPPVASIVIPVHSGGYLNPDSSLDPKDGTTCPAGSLPLTPTQNGGVVAGFPMDATGTGRGAIEFHGPGVSEGCIVCDDGADWESARNQINNGNGGNCVHNLPRQIPVTVTYSGVTPVT